MSDYRDWCRLCGGLYAFAEIQDEILLFIENLMEISPDSIKICSTCEVQINETVKFIDRAKYLQRLFKGLAEESETDLTTARLNAYRSHFDLDTKIEETEMITINDLELDQHQDFEYIEYKLEDETFQDQQQTLEETVIMESIEDENYEEETSSLIQEDYEEEIYEQDDDDTEDYEQPQQARKSTQGMLEKTEEEKLFTFQCHLCDHSEFNKMKFLKLHCKQAHNCLPLVKCCYDKCDSVLSTWRRLLMHRDKHFPNDDQLRCRECQKVYVSVKALEKHLLSHRVRYICSHCGKEFKETKTLRFHEETHNKSLEERRNHACHHPDCDLRFITKQAMQNHYDQKHQRVASFFCKEPGCERGTKGFYSRKGFLEHKRIHGERKFFCNSCNFKAKTRSALNSHKDTHKVGEAYSCDICSSGFSSFRRLRSHMVCHSDLTPFKCLYCESAFKRRKDWKDHLNVHTKERPFNCQFCTRTFTNAANRRKHSLKDHVEELKAWELENGKGGRMKLECYQ